MQNRSSFSRECVQTWWMCFEMNFILVFFCTNLLSEYPNSFQSKPRRVIGISSEKGPVSCPRIKGDPRKKTKKRIAPSLSFFLPSSLSLPPSHTHTEGCFMHSNTFVTRKEMWPSSMVRRGGCLWTFRLLTFIYRADSEYAKGLHCKCGGVWSV